MEVKKDSGWAWMISLATFTAVTLETGTVKALGVMLPTLRQQFSTPTWVIGLGISLAPGFGAITSPLAGALSKRMSPRSIVMVFSLLAVTALIVASVSTSVPILLLSLLSTGISRIYNLQLKSFLLGAESVVISQMVIYFEEYYDIANAFGQAGMAVGIIVMPPLMQLFLDIYGWRGTILLLAGINLHFTVSGALLRPVSTVNDTHIGKIHNNDYIPLVQRKSNIDSYLANVVYYLDLTLFTDASFLSMLTLYTANGYCLTGWLVYLVPHSIDLGFEPYHASFIATAGGIGNLIASIVYPFMTKTLSPSLLLYIGSLMITLSLAMDPVVSLFHSYIGLALMSIVFGFWRAIAMMSVMKVIKNVIEEEKITNAVLWINVGYSVGSILSGFFSGWFFDLTGNYVLSFLTLSAISLLGICPQFLLEIGNNSKRKSLSK
ncbi:monocarboxylate transporter 13-like [Amphiura filiformis]|uniref:monocarboxylate transporter 13-like n=1 Tax=Amphiura filiformis TaxID=82378 RepID=UPI003B214E11